MRQFFENRVAAVAIGATVVVGFGATGAVAASTMGSDDIRNGGVRSLDIRNGGVKKVDVSKGAVGSPEVANRTLGLRDMRSSAVNKLRGAQGPRGLRGPQGLPGSSDGLLDESVIDTLSHVLYVLDGTQQMSTITYELKDPITFSEFDMTFLQEQVLDGTGANVFGASVILGVDANDDGHYDAKDLAWHIGDTRHDPGVLNEDTFVSMDALPSSETMVTARDVPQWWTPNVAGDGFNLVDPNCYNTLETVVNQCTDVRFDPDDKIEVIRLVLGGSGSWEDVAYRLTTLGVSGEIEEIRHVTFPKGHND